jgi:hypothetical protein
MKIIALMELNAGKTMADLGPLVAPEARTVWEQIKTGAIRNIHYRTDKPGAMIEFEVAGVAAAQALIAELPAVKAGVIQAGEYIPLAPYTGFESLFAAA